MKSETFGRHKHKVWPKITEEERFARWCERIKQNALQHQHGRSLQLLLPQRIASWLGVEPKVILLVSGDIVCTKIIGNAIG